MSTEYSLLSDKLTLHPNETVTFEWSLLPGEEPFGLDVRNFGKVDASLGIMEPRYFSCRLVSVEILNSTGSTALVQLALRVTYEAPHVHLN